MVAAHCDSDQGSWSSTGVLSTTSHMFCGRCRGVCASRFHLYMPMAEAVAAESEVIPLVEVPFDVYLRHCRSSVVCGFALAACENSSARLSYRELDRGIHSSSVTGSSFDTPRWFERCQRAPANSETALRGIWSATLRGSTISTSGNDWLLRTREDFLYSYQVLPIFPRDTFSQSLKAQRLLHDRRGKLTGLDGLSMSFRSGRSRCSRDSNLPPTSAIHARLSRHSMIPGDASIPYQMRALLAVTL